MCVCVGVVYVRAQPYVKSIVFMCVVALARRGVLIVCVLIPASVCMYLLWACVDPFMCECASSYGNQIIVCMCVLGLRMMGNEGGCLLCVFVCVSSLSHVIASLPSQAGG